MSERGPRFEAYEASHSPEKGPYLHTPEVAPDEICGATVELSTLFESNNGVSAEAAVSCNNCTIFDNLSAAGANLDFVQSAIHDEARELIKNECPLWRMRQTGTPAPDWFLPRDLRP